jgi:hypothetical protein
MNRLHPASMPAQPVVGCWSLPRWPVAVRAVLPGLVESKLIADKHHDGVEQATAATGRPSQEFVDHAALHWNYAIRARHTRGGGAECQGLMYGGVSGGDHEQPSLQVAVGVACDNCLLSNAEGVSRTHQRYAGRPFMSAFCEGAGLPCLRTTKSICPCAKANGFSGRIKHEYNTSCWLVCKPVQAAQVGRTISMLARARES